MSRTEAEEIALARSMMRRRVTSIVEDQGAYSSSCGYCKSSSLTSVAQGLWAHTLTVDDYQELLNRGWRRSGMFLYKPKMHRTCCPPHSIRLNVNAFVFSKEQSRVMRRMQRYLEGSYHGTRPSDNPHPSSSNASGAPVKDLVGAVTTPRGKKSVPPELGPQCSAKKIKTSEMEDEAAVQLSASIKDAISKCAESRSLPQDLVFPQISVRKVTENTRGKLKEIEGQLDYTSNIAFGIAAAVKKQRRKAITEMEVESGSEVNRLEHLSSQLEFSPSLVAEILVSQLRDSNALSGCIPQACKGHLNFLTVGCRVEGNPPSSGKSSPVLSLTTEGAPRKPASEDIGSEGKELNRSPPPHPLPSPDGSHGRELNRSPPPPPLPSPDGSHGRELNPPPPPPPLPSPDGSHERELNSPPSPLLPVKSRHIEIQIKESSFDPEEFALYKKYQIAVHNDKPEEVKESSYCRFLVDTPLIYVAPEDDGSTPSCGFGSFHQQYRIDGKLVAVGVVDILPHCLSSKYLFWDPDLAFLSLGKYSALREIQWVQEEHKMCPSLSYYYLGFYIHTCPKMRYKAAYAPSELLCPSKYIWVPYEQTRAALARAQYLCLSDVLTQNGSATERSAEELQKAENMEESSENDNEEMSIDTLVVDAEVDNLPSNRAEPSGTENGPPFPHSGEEDETMEKFKDHSESLGKIVLLVNNKCLTFKRLKEMRVVNPEYMAVLTEELISYMQAVGPELASRMVFVPR